MSITRTGLPILVELIDLLNSVIIFLSEKISNFPTWIPDCDSHSPALLDLFLSSNASICSAMVFPPLKNSYHVVVSVPIDFPSNSQWNAPFHRIAYGYSHSDWDDLHDHLEDVPWEDIFRLSASAGTNEFCE